MLIATYFFVFDTNNEVTPIDRNIKFPRDEGFHDDEKMEYWTFSGYFESDNGGAFFYLVRYWHTGKREVHFTDINNITGDEYYWKYNYPSDEINPSVNINVGNTSLDLDYRNDRVHDTWIETDTEDFVYELNTQLTPKTSELVRLNLTLRANKNPVPLGEKGKISLGSYGTLFSYIQSNLTISGKMTLNGNTNYVDGYGRIEHGWGLSNLGRLESWVLLLSNGNDLLITKLYTSTDDLFLEYAYVIDKNGNFDVVLYPVQDYALTYKQFEEQNITVQHTKYFRNPNGDGNYYFGLDWYFQSTRNNFNISAYPEIDYQMATDAWEGFSYASGTFQGHQVSGLCFVSLYRSFYGNLTIANVSDNYYSTISLENPNDPVTVTAKTSGELGNVKASLFYNVNNNTITEVVMEPIGNNTYEGTIPGTGINPVYKPVVTYGVRVSDDTGKVFESELQSYTVSIEAP